MRQPNRIFRGKITSGKICLEFRDQFAKLIQFLDGKDVEVILRKLRKQRSLPQNAYYFGVVVALLSEHTGYDPEEMHEALKEKFLRDRAHEVPGLVKIRSSSNLDTAEFTEYIEACRRLGAEMGVNIPDPGEASA